MSKSVISDSVSSSYPRMSPSRLRANTVEPAPTSVIFAMAASYDPGRDRLPASGYLIA